MNYWAYIWKKQWKTHQRNQKNWSQAKMEKNEAKQQRTGKTNETEPKIEKGHALIHVAIQKN